jgi:sulfate-transporting ATPase
MPIVNEETNHEESCVAQYIYTMNRVSKMVPPKREILKDISLSFFPGAKIGVLGLNGAGKSTLLKIMAGVDKDFNGEARAQPGIKIGYLEQEPPLDPNKDVRGNVEDGLREPLDAMARLDQVFAEYADPDADFDKLAKEQEKLESIIQAWDAHNLNNQMEQAADALRLPPWDADVTKLSGGERRRVALCRLLLSKPDMLLLDEPTNHLDAESVSWLERFLKDFAGTIVAITHDRYFLDNVAEWILELDRGHGIPYQGNYTNWLEQKNARLEQEQKARRSLCQSTQARIGVGAQKRQGSASQIQSPLERFEELNSREFQQRNETAEIYIPPGPRLGNKVIEVEGISKSFGDRLLYENLSFSVPPTAIVGIVGPNGAGKTTLFKMITGEQKPDTGTVTVGDTVKVAYVGQIRDTLDNKKTVWEEVSDGLDMITVGEYETPSRAYIGRFNFKGQDQQKRVGELSGGERNRLQLAKTLRQGANVILLDEPSNDLDVETLRALEEAIQVFPGTVMVVSHDRWFLDRIATHILAFEDEGPQWFDGNYTEYEKWRKEKLGDAAQPKRAKYRKIGG